MIYRVDPLIDQRWGPFVERHPNSSIFHTAAWLEALRRTYGYEPVVYTTSAPQKELANGLVFCRVSSWLTGSRLVSLPFSDHCDLLVEKGNNGSVVFEEVRKEQETRKWEYIEVRPRNDVLDQHSYMQRFKSYCSHRLDLRPDEKTLFSCFHKDCTQRKIQRAEREKLTYTAGCSRELLKMFYKLFARTRQRHGLPPQPFRWFQNLSECMGPAMQVRAAFQGGRLVASIVTLRFGKTLLYKYGCSDARFNNLGGTQWLFWKIIREAKAQGMQELDLGRSDWDNPGLIIFKDRLGGKRFPINYWQYPKVVTQSCRYKVLNGPAGWVVGHTPLPILVIAGRLLYRHIG